MVVTIRESFLPNARQVCFDNNLILFVTKGFLKMGGEN